MTGFRDRCGAALDLDALPDDRWPTDVVDQVVAWFSTVRRQDNDGVSRARGGLLTHELRDYVRQTVEAIAEAYNETVHRVDAAVIAVPDPGLPWTCPVDQPGRNAHRRRVVAFVPLTSALGGDLAVRLQPHADIFEQIAPNPAEVKVGTIHGCRASHAHGFTAVDHGERSWLIALGSTRP